MSTDNQEGLRALQKWSSYAPDSQHISMIFMSMERYIQALPSYVICLELKGISFFCPHTCTGPVGLHRVWKIING